MAHTHHSSDWQWSTVCCSRHYLWTIYGKYSKTVSKKVRPVFVKYYKIKTWLHSNISEDLADWILFTELTLISIIHYSISSKYASLWLQLVSAHVQYTTEIPRAPGPLNNDEGLNLNHDSQQVVACQHVNGGTAFKTKEHKTWPKRALKNWILLRKIELNYLPQLAGLSQKLQQKIKWSAVTDMLELFRDMLIWGILLVIIAQLKKMNKKQSRVFELIDLLSPSSHNNTEYYFC